MKLTEYQKMVQNQKIIKTRKQSKLDHIYYPVIEKRHHTIEPYYIEKIGPNINIILRPNSNHPKELFLTLPIKRNNQLPSNVLKILWENGYLSKDIALKRFIEWKNDNLELIFEQISKKGIKEDLLILPVKRRGNKAYHDYTWSKLQYYKLMFESFNKTILKTKKSIKFKSFNRKIEYSNILFLTVTYQNEDSYKIFNHLSEDLNRYQTALKARLKRRGLQMLFYIKAIECQKNGNPHAHFLIKLENAIPFYRIYSRKSKKTVLKPFEKELFEWKHGYYDVTGVTENNCYGYITKYITKVTKKNNDESRLETSNDLTLALTWISRKRLYSTTTFDLLKKFYPNFKEKTGTTEKCTVLKLKDLYIKYGLKFPKFHWEKEPESRAKYRLPERAQIDNTSKIILKLPLDLRCLNYEGSYQVVALRRLHPGSNTELFPLTPRKNSNKDPPNPTK